jgi:hypothetical protein
MKQTVILNIHDTSGSIMELIVTTSKCILVIAQERFEKIHSYHMYDVRPQDCKKMLYLAIFVVELNLTSLTSRSGMGLEWIWVIQIFGYLDI